MSYDLCFSPEFFFAEGEPYDGGPEPSNRPISVWNAIESMKILEPEKWANLAQDVFKMEPEFLTVETVLDKVRETNTCLDIRSPVQVYIDPGRNYSILIYDK